MSSTPAQYAIILIDLALEAGADRDALLAGSRLAEEGVEAIGARVAEADFHQLATNAQAITGDPALGLRLGQRLNLSAHAVLGQAFLACRNLAEVIDLFERYYRVLAPDLNLEFREDAQSIILEAVGTDTGLPLEFGLECIAAGMRNTLGGLLGEPLLPLRFEFPYPEPDHGDVYREVLGDDLLFNSDTARWSFPREQMSRELPSSNPTLRRLYEAECARVLADLQDSDDLATRSRRLLRKFEGQYPQMPQVASMLNVSARTYRRRLAEEGTSYQALLDTVRAEHATRHLRDGRLPIASIAYQLGFTDPSNFRRAFQRWTGRTPGAVRREARGEQS